jgi:hypothetical protein
MVINIRAVDQISGANGGAGYPGPRSYPKTVIFMHFGASESTFSREFLERTPELIRVG